MSVYITVLLKYETREQSPAFSARMEALGGKVAAVHFGDLFAEYEGLEAQLEARRCEHGGLGSTGACKAASESTTERQWDASGASGAASSKDADLLNLSVAPVIEPVEIREVKRKGKRT